MRPFLLVTLSWLLFTIHQRMANAFLVHHGRSHGTVFGIPTRNGIQSKQQQQHCHYMADSSSSSSTPPENDEDLAAAFAMFAKASGVQLSEEELSLTDDEEEEDDDDEEEDDEEEDMPVTENVDSLNPSTSVDVSLTNEKIYSEVKERVLDTAGGFVDFLKGPSDDDDDDDDNDDVDTNDPTSKKPKVYQPPSTTPDAELTAGEVVESVLDALLHLDTPEPLYGMQVLFGYSSDSSQIKQEEGLTPAEYTDYLKDSEYKVLFNHQGVSIEKGDYSFDGKKAFYTAHLKVGEKVQDIVAVNIILSNAGEESDAWMVDSLLIRPESMRRRRRK